MDEEQRGLYGIIPKDVLTCDDLPPNAKILYADITNLTGTCGYCWASNQRFAELYNVTPRSISTWLRKLEENGFIFTEIVTHGNNQGTQERRIYVSIDVIEVLRSGRNFPVLRKKFSAASEEIFQSLNIKKINNKKYMLCVVPEGEEKPKEPKAPTQPKELQQEQFEQFWQEYRAHVPKGTPVGDKQRAIKAWYKLKPDESTRNAMLDGLAAQAQQKDWQRGIGIPHCSTWINGRRWESVPEYGEMDVKPQPLPRPSEVDQW